MNPSTSLNCFFDPTFKMPVQAQIQRLYDAGFRTLDMNFWDFSHSSDSPFVKDTWEDWVHAIREYAQTLGISFTQAHGHVCNFYTHPDDEAHALLKRALRGAAILGIPWVVFHPSQSPDWQRDPDYRQMISDNVRYFTPLAELGASLGVGLALENMPAPRDGIPNAEHLSELIDRFQSPYVGACWDTGHAHIAGVDQAASIHTLGGRLTALHIQDNDGVSDQHLAPYFGSTDWASLTAALKETGYPGDFTFEAHMQIRRVPEEARFDAARLLFSIGKYLARS